MTQTCSNCGGKAHLQPGTCIVHEGKKTQRFKTWICSCGHITITQCASHPRKRGSNQKTATLLY